MNKTARNLTTTIAACTLMAGSAFAKDAVVSDDVIEKQRAALVLATKDAGFGPQSPRDIDSTMGKNFRSFGNAPEYTAMNLCNIHFHENAEHRGGQFKTFAGNGNGKGYGTGFKYDGELTAAELAPVENKIGVTDYGSLEPGDTIEIHFVHSSAQVTPGPTLGACVSDAIKNPHLRVETVVAVLVNGGGSDFLDMAKLGMVDGLHQAVNLPNDLGDPVQYAGSTTGPSYNEAGSPFHVTWNVRPNVVKLDINSVGSWLSNNVFDEGYAHGVRNLVTNPDLLSPIK